MGLFFVMKSSHIKLIAGLGNPGARFENTYHNIGLLALDWLLKNKFGAVSHPSQKVRKLFEYRKIDDFVLLRPLIFMNEVGLAIDLAAQYFKITAANVLIIHDDSDIPLGQFKLSLDRGSAGHKGIESIIQRLGSKKFWRLRIGIRPAGFKGRAEEFVLSKISGANRKKFAEVFEKIAGSNQLAAYLAP